MQVCTIAGTAKWLPKIYDRETLKVISPTFAHHSDLDFLLVTTLLSHDGMRVLLPRGLLASDTRASGKILISLRMPIKSNNNDLLTGKEVHAPLPDQQDFYDFPLYDAKSTLIATQSNGKIYLNATDGTSLHQLTIPPPRAHAAFISFRRQRTPGHRPESCHFVGIRKERSHRQLGPSRSVHRR